MTTKKKRDRAPERRSEKRAIDVGVGKKKISDALIEEATDEAFVWLERGGLQRLWTVIKVTALTIIVLLGAAILFLIETAN